jgi:hypothetical protein
MRLARGQTALGLRALLCRFAGVAGVGVRLRFR